MRQFHIKISSIKQFLVPSYGRNLSTKRHKFTEKIPKLHFNPTFSNTLQSCSSEITILFFFKIGIVPGKETEKSETNSAVAGKFRNLSYWLTVLSIRAAKNQGSKLKHTV